MKTKEEILEAYDYDKGAPHWVTKKAAIKAMQAYADQQVNKVLDEVIADFKRIKDSPWTNSEIIGVLKQNKLKQS